MALEETVSEAGAECRLPPAELAERGERWRRLAAQALTSTKEAGVVRSTYPPTEDIRRELTELINAEALCCPFLDFEVSEQEGAIEVKLHYPPEFQPIIPLSPRPSD